MALVNASLMIASYTDDFGNTYTNVPIKFGDNVVAAVLTAMGYTARGAGIVCGGNLPFGMRYLQAIFADGSSHQFPIANRADLAARIASLQANNAVCINLVGEKWSLLTPKVVGDATFKNTPYTDISSTGKKVSYSYEYGSDVLAAASVLTLSTAIEEAPTTLHDCQKEGLVNPQATGGGICSGAGLGIRPRHYIINALAKKGTETAQRRVVRQVIISAEAAADIKGKADDISECAYCLGYKGESIANVHTFI